MKSSAARTFCAAAAASRSGSCGMTFSASSAGFPLPLPIRYSVVPPDQPYTLTPLEMLARHDILTVRQAAYCLNVSERQIYDYIAEGKLVKLKDTPVRVRADEVKALRKDFDE